MKALLSKAVGGPETLVLEDIPSPTPQARPAVVSVKAVGVNYPDVLIIEDKYQFKPPRPFAPGGEISGVVKEVGEGVTSVKAGDRVLGNISCGGMVEELALEAARLIKIPDAMPFDEAAAFIMTYGTRYYALKDRGFMQARREPAGAGRGRRRRPVGGGARQGDGRAGDRRGVIAGEGGPRHGARRRERRGLSARARSTATARRRWPTSSSRRWGRTASTWSTTASAATTPRPRSARMAWEGRFLVVGFPAGIPRMPLNLTLLKSCDVVGVFWGAAVARDPTAHPQNVKELMELYAGGKIRPHVSEHYPLDRAAEAITHLASRKALGKVVVMVD